MQEAGQRDAALWPTELHLRADDFDLMKSVTSILEPMRDVTKELSATTSWVGDVLPLLTSGIDAVARMEVSSRSIVLQKSLVESLPFRLEILLGYEGVLPCVGGRKLSEVFPNEFVISALLNPWFSSAIDLFYGYSERVVLNEIERLIESRFDNNETDDEDNHNVTMNLNQSTTALRSTAEIWADRTLATPPRRTSRQKNATCVAEERTTLISG